MNVKSLKEVLEDTTPPPEEIIGNGILPSKSLLLVTGEPKTKKSLLVFNFAVALAEGESFSFFEIGKSYKILILSAEGGYYPNRDRIKKMYEQMVSPGDSKLNIVFDCRIKLDDDDDYKELQNQLKVTKPELLIIDPLVKFHNMDENSAKEMGIILDRLRNLIEDYNLSIILVHHLGKNPKSGARGSSAIIGEYDSSITINKENKKGQHKFEFDLRHSITPDNIFLKFDSKTFWFEFDENPIVKILKEYGSMGKKDLVELLVLESYFKQSGAYKAIDREVKKGTIKKNENDEYCYKDTWQVEVS